MAGKNTCLDRMTHPAVHAYDSSADGSLHTIQSCKFMLNH